MISATANPMLLFGVRCHKEDSHGPVALPPKLFCLSESVVHGFTVSSVPGYGAFVISSRSWKSCTAQGGILRPQLWWCDPARHFAKSPRRNAAVLWSVFAQRPSKPLRWASAVVQPMFCQQQTTNASSIIFNVWGRHLVAGFSVNRESVAGLEVTDTTSSGVSLSATSPEVACKRAHQRLHAAVFWPLWKLLLNCSCFVGAHYIDEFVVFSGIHHKCCQPSPNEVAGKVYMLRDIALNECCVMCAMLLAPILTPATSFPSLCTSACHVS